MKKKREEKGKMEGERKGKRKGEGNREERGSGKRGMFYRPVAYFLPLVPHLQQLFKKVLVSVCCLGEEIEMRGE
jgi:hypothetical protein